MSMHGAKDPLPEVVAYYETRYDEDQRLAKSPGRLEFARTREIIQRYLPPTCQSVLDIGGASGPYSFWLAGLGYRVTLLDPVERHIVKAQELANSGTYPSLEGIMLGEARHLPCENGSFDAVLLMGPLYHLPEQSDRVQAIHEACRVLRPGGVCFVAVISRYASLLDGYFGGGIEDPDFVAIVKDDLENGRHRNPTDKPYFTVAYLHEPGEIAEDIKMGGLEHLTTLALEGPFWMLKDLDEHLDDPIAHERLFSLLRIIEDRAALLGCSAHLVAVAQKP